MAYVVLVPDLARRPHYCFATETAALRFDRVFGGSGGYLPRNLMTPHGRPFVIPRDIDFVKQKLEQTSLPYVVAPATDYVRMDDNLAVGGIFRERQNTRQESEMVPFW